MTKKSFKEVGYPYTMYKKYGPFICGTKKKDTEKVEV